MFKKFTCFILIAVFTICSLSAFADYEPKEWEILYQQKMNEITTAYENGTKVKVEDYGMGHPYFSVQDINFDGVPELYHAIISLFEHEPYVLGNEEIYYIKDGKVLQGVIESKQLDLIPMYQGRKTEPGVLTGVVRWQYAMQNRQTGEVCFITNSSYSGFVEFPEIKYSKLTFDSTTGVLKSEVLLHREIESYTEPVYLQGYDYVGADCYTSISSGYGWGISDWKACYLAPKVIVNGKRVDFDVQPQIINGRVMVPLRAIFETLGAEVSWDNATSTVTATKDNVTVQMTIGAYSFIKNGETVGIDTPPITLSSRTLVPVRAVAEAFGSIVGWEGVTKTVTINDAPSKNGGPSINNEIISEILNNKRTFIEFDSQKETTLGNIGNVNDYYSGKAHRFAIVDMDSDGKNELIVEHSSNGDTAIITMRDDGVLVAYYAPYRGIKWLKTDGTASGSSSAFDSSDHKILAFTDKGIVWHDMVYFNSGEITGKPRFEIDGVIVTEELVNEAGKIQNNKEDVKWFDIE